MKHNMVKTIKEVRYDPMETYSVSGKVTWYNYMANVARDWDHRRPTRHPEAGKALQVGHLDVSISEIRFAKSRILTHNNH